jgi:excisionase family DNA binding protein
VDKNTSFREKVESLLLSRLTAEMEKKGHLMLAFTVPEVAKFLGINKIKMYELARSDRFPKIILGNRILIPIGPFMEWIEETAWT